MYKPSRYFMQLSTFDCWTPYSSMGSILYKTSMQPFAFNCRTPYSSMGSTMGSLDLCRHGAEPAKVKR